MLSRRLGLATDPALLVQRVSTDSAGRERILDINEVDDASPVLGNRQYQSANHDPVFRLEAVEGGTYRIRVLDLYGGAGGSPSHLYRLSIREAAPTSICSPWARDRRDTALVASLWVPYLRKGESMALKVFALRRDDFDGEISLEVEGLPPGVSCGPALIPADRSVTDLICKVARDAAGGIAAIGILGKAHLDKREVRREALWASPLRTVADLRGTLFQSRLTRELILAVSEKETLPCFPVSKWKARNGRHRWPGSWTFLSGSPAANSRRAHSSDPSVSPGCGKPIQSLSTPLGKGTVTLELPRPLTPQLKVEPGQYTFYLEASARIPYRNNPEAAKGEQRERRRIERLASQLAVAARKVSETEAGIEGGVDR